MHWRNMALVAALAATSGCSGIVTNLAADALGGGGSNFASDDDPELVGEAIPFGLKTIEGLLESDPDNEKLLLSASSGFTQYAYAFVQQEADFLDEENPARSRELYQRAKRLFARARGYGMRGLEERHEGFREEFAKDRAKALAEMEREDVPFLYWTAASWALQIALSKDDMGALGQLPEMEALMARALELDPDWDAGAIHEFYVTYDGSRSESMGGSPKRAREHFERALQLSEGKKIGPYVTWAEVVAVGNQDRKLFDEMIEKALAFDAHEEPRFRLVNLIAQKRARWLKARTADLFVEE